MDKNKVPSWQGWTDWLDAKRVAAETGFAYGTVLQWIHRDVDPLPVYRTGEESGRFLVYREELNDWLKKNLAHVIGAGKRPRTGRTKAGQASRA